MVKENDVYLQRVEQMLCKHSHWNEIKIFCSECETFTQSVKVVTDPLINIHHIKSIYCTQLMIFISFLVDIQQEKKKNSLIRLLVSPMIFKII